MKRISRRRAAYHIICILAIGALAAYFIVRFDHVFYRTWESLRDIGRSIAYYVGFIVNAENPVQPTVTELPRDFNEILPVMWGDFVTGMQSFGRALITMENFRAYLSAVRAVLYDIVIIMMMVIPPLLLAILIMYTLIFKRKNRDHGKLTSPLRAYLRIRAAVWLPIKRFCAGLIRFVRNKKIYAICAICMAVFFSNAVNILLEFIAFYLYLLVSFDFGNIYIQVIKLISDLAPLFLYVPAPVWIVAAIVIFDRLRKRIAYEKLTHLEQKNREFLAEQPIAILVTGVMRSGKTTTLTDMQLSFQAMEWEQAERSMREIDNKFPFFPWINLEIFVRRCVRHHAMYSLESIRQMLEPMRAAQAAGGEVYRGLLRKLRRRYGYGHRDLCFGYDLNSYPDGYDSGISYDELFDALIVYAQLYFIFITPTLLVGNYSIRTEDWLETDGNAPRRRVDFFRDISAESFYSHILDQDMLRPGKKVDDHGEYNNAYEFGIVGISEAGKERGNQKTQEGIKKLADTANQKNDLFNLNLKMIGHSATVYYHPYVRVLMDEQRPQSINADLLQLLSVIDVVEPGREKIILPFFAIEELLYLALTKFFDKLYEAHRYNRGDITLTLYLLRLLYLPVFRHFDRVRNRYSVRTARMRVQAGTMDEGSEYCKYHLMRWKIFSQRFSTDSHHQFYARKASRSKFGINDIPTYEELQASFDELQSQKSFFIADVTEAFKD